MKTFLLVVCLLALVVAAYGSVSLYLLANNKPTLSTVTSPSIPPGHPNTEAAPEEAPPATEATATEAEPETSSAPETEEVPATESEPQERSVVIDLSKAKVTTKNSVRTYDFNLNTDDGHTIYGLGVLDENEFVIMFASEVQLERVVWVSKEGTTSYSESGPPDDLEMNINGAPGSNYWYTLPADAVKAGEIRVYYMSGTAP